MKRAGIVGLLIVIGISFAVAPAQAKKKKVRVESEVTLEFVAFNDYAWVGEVISAKPRCERSRTVTVSYVGTGDPFTYGSATTEDDGSWRLPVELGETVGGDHQATVSKRKIRKKHKIIVCKPAESAIYDLD
jgi:hypothetical protein